MLLGGFFPNLLNLTLFGSFFYGHPKAPFFVIITHLFVAKMVI